VEQACSNPNAVVLRLDESVGTHWSSTSFSDALKGAYVFELPGVL